MASGESSSGRRHDDRRSENEPINSIRPVSPYRSNDYAANTVSGEEAIVKTMDPNLNCIPEEIVFDILTKLPVKSLCRFRCVSKSWFSIISSPVFVADHLTRSISRPKLLISVQRVDPETNRGLGNFFSIEYPEQSDTQTLHAISCSSTEFTDYSMISQSPSGLICFECNQGIKIGNPITGDFDVLLCNRSESLFFGFDPVEKRHVILKLDDSSSVFDLVDNCWHETQPHPWLMGGYYTDDICINGVIYFIAYDVRTNSNSFIDDDCVYGFDVRLKSFEKITCPPDLLKVLGQGGYPDEHLIEYKGRVAYVSYENLYDIKMWILEDADNHIWSSKSSFAVSWRENLIRDGISIGGLQSWDSHRLDLKVNLLGASHRGELILATSLWNSSSYLFFYEIETSTLRRFQVDGVGKTLRGVVMFNWLIESLELVPKLSEKKKEER